MSVELTDYPVKQIKIGLVMMGSPRWSGGISYMQNLISCLKYLPAEERPQVVLFVGKVTPKEHYRGLIDEYTTVRVTKLNNWRTPIELFTSKIFAGRWASAFSRDVAASGVDTVYPVNVPPIRPLPVPWAGWIPDFQHIHLPEMFSAHELIRRDAGFRRLAEVAPLIVLSSRDAEKDFNRFFQNSGTRTRILSFSSVLAPDVFENDVESIRRKYNLPPRFLLITNQFWKHKGHLTAFKALRILRDRREDIPLYCCGNMQDYRNPEYVETLRRYITDNGLGCGIKVLGLVPRDDQIQIMRAATALVQPTLFEGWSTVIEEGKSLGKVMYISDLPVNLEQKADGAIYFARESAEDLAEKIVATWQGLKTCPDSEAEAAARARNEERYANFARTLVSIMQDVCLCNHRT